MSGHSRWGMVGDFRVQNHPSVWRGLVRKAGVHFQQGSEVGSILKVSATTSQDYDAPLMVTGSYKGWKVGHEPEKKPYVSRQRDPGQVCVWEEHS